VHQQEGKVTTNGNRATDIAAVGSKRRRRNGFLKKKGEEMVFEKKRRTLPVSLQINCWAQNSKM
jgi:hypothetical protein